MQRDATGLSLAIGEKAPYFSLKATDGKIYSISDFRNGKPLVVIFTCNHCPYAQAYEGRIVELAKEYQEHGVQFIAICANDSVGYPEDDFEHMVEKSKKLGYPFPYLHDESQTAAKAYDAACTPEVYVFDGEHKLCYHGRVDDNYQDRTQVTSQDLRKALAAVVMGENPDPALTPAIGCSIKWRR